MYWKQWEEEDKGAQGFFSGGSEKGDSARDFVVLSNLLTDRVLEVHLPSCSSVLTPRLYSCLANGSADEFQRGDQLFRMRAVKDPLQIGRGIPSCPVTPPWVSPLPMYPHPPM